jgi:hypothetical protein
LCEVGGIRCVLFGAGWWAGKKLVLGCNFWLTRVSGLSIVHLLFTAVLVFEN